MYKEELPKILNEIKAAMENGMKKKRRFLQNSDQVMKSIWFKFFINQWQFLANACFEVQGRDINEMYAFENDLNSCKMVTGFLF